MCLYVSVCGKAIKETWKMTYICTIRHLDVESGDVLLGQRQPQMSTLTLSRNDSFQHKYIFKVIMSCLSSKKIWNTSSLLE